MSIEVRNLSHIYNKGMADQHVAFEDVSFSVANGEIAAIVGHTGSGKSTLLQHLNGLLKADSGSIFVDDAEITKEGISLVEVRKKVGLVFQYPEYQLFEETVAKDVSFGPKNLGLDEEAVAERVKKSLKLVGLPIEEFGERSPFDLSGGQKRRVAIAGVLAMEPRVLILDEPAAGLDPKSHKDIIELIKKVNEIENNIILFVSHDMDEVAALADKVFVMNHGKMVLSGTPGEVFSQRDRLREMSLGVPEPMEFLTELGEKGLDLRRDALSLDDAEEILYEYLSERGNL